MALDFPSNPVDGQIYGNFYYSASKDAWRATTDFNTPNTLRNANITTATAATAPLTVTGYASQSANLQEWKNSSGAILSKINASGMPTFPGGTFTSPVTFQVGGVNTIELGGSSYGSIEIGKQDGTASQPYIDFHSSAAVSDYNARIIADGGSSSQASGTLAIQAAQLSVPSQTYFPGAIVQAKQAQTNSVLYQTSYEIANIAGLEISFTPKFSNSKILLTAAINSDIRYVATFGFRRDGNVVSSTNNNNSTGSVATVYYGTDTNTHIMNTYIEYSESAGSTAARTYAAAACASWGGGLQTLTINDRGSSLDMRSVSSMTIYEIAQ